MSALQFCDLWLQHRCAIARASSRSRAPSRRRSRTACEQSCSHCLRCKVKSEMAALMVSRVKCAARQQAGGVHFKPGRSVAPRSNASCAARRSNRSAISRCDIEGYRDCPRAPISASPSLAAAPLAPNSQLIPLLSYALSCPLSSTP